MKTTTIVIIGIIIVAVSGIAIFFAYNQEIRLATGMIKSDEKPVPRPMLAVETFFNEEENSVSYLIFNGNTNKIEIDIPLDMIDGVFMVYVNDQIVDDDRVSVNGTKVIVNYDQNIKSVKLMGYREISGLEDEGAYSENEN